MAVMKQTPTRLRHMATATPSSATYALTDDQLEFREAIRKMAVERVAPRAAEIDAKAEYPWDIRRLFAEHDLMGLPFDETHGGTGTGTLMLNVAVEEGAGGRALARHQRVRGGGRPARVQRRQARAQARHQGLADRPADLRRRPRAGGEPDRRG